MYPVQNSQAFKVALISIFVTLLSFGSKAITQLPYIGPEAKQCEVHTPKEKSLKELDGGYLTSEDCKVIYVKPPKIGRVTNSSYRETLLAPLCGPINSLIKIANDMFEYNVDKSLERKSLIEMYVNENNPQKRKQIENDLGNLAQQISSSSKMFKAV